MSFLAENDKLASNQIANRTTSNLGNYLGYGVSINTVPKAGDKTNLSAALGSIKNFHPNDQVRIIQRAGQAGLLAHHHAADLITQILTNQRTAPIKLNPLEKAVSFGATAGKIGVNFGKGLYQSTAAPVVSKAEQQFKYLSGKTSTQAQRTSIIKNQNIRIPNAPKTGGVAAGIKARQMIAAGAKESEVQAYIKKASKAMDANNKRGLGAALSLASLAVGGGELRGVNSISKAVRAVAPLTAAGAAGNTGATLITNPRASMKKLAISAAEGAAGGAVIPFAGAVVGKGVRAGKAALAETPLTKAASRVHANKIANDEKIAPVHVSETNGDALKASPQTSKSLAAVDNPSVEQGFGTAKNPRIPDVTPSHTVPKEGRFKNSITVNGELSRQGKSGQEIVNRLSKVESTSEVGQAAFLKKIPSVTKLKGKEFSNFVDTLGELSKVEGKSGEQKVLAGLTPKMRQAVKEWSQGIPEIRKRAEAAGVKVGDLGKYYFPRNYSELLSTKKGLAKAAQHLVDSGQAKNVGEAVQALKFAKNEYSTPFGHFEKSRNFDIPGYDKSRNALVNYVNGAYNKIGHAEQFGPKGEVANTLIGQIGQEGYDADRALMNYQKATGQFKYHNPGVGKALGKVRGFNRTTKLGLSSILNATQSVNTAAVAGAARTASAALKQLSKTDREYVESTGVRIDSVINALREQTGAASNLAKSANALQKALGKIVNAPGFGQVEKFNRGVAAIAGRDWANSLAKKGSPKAISILRDKLGIEGDIGRTLTLDQQIQASRKVVELTQFKTGAKDLPGWTDSPMGKTVAQFRTFSYKQTGFLYNELIKEAKRGNILPLMRFIAIGTPVGIAAGGIRNELGGKPFYGDSKGQSVAKKLLGATYQGSSNVGGTGLLGSAIFLGQNATSPNAPAYVAGDIGGPTFGLGASAVLARSQGKTAEKRLALGQVPVAGPYLKNKYTPYGTAQMRSFDKAAPEGVAKVLVKAGYQPKDPSDARSKQLKTSNPKQYQQELDKSNKLFVQKVKKAQADPSFQSLSAAAKKRTLSSALSDARKETLKNMNIQAPRRKKSQPVKHY